MVDLSIYEDVCFFKLILVIFWFVSFFWFCMVVGYIYEERLCIVKIMWCIISVSGEVDWDLVCVLIVNVDLVL